MDEKLKNNPYYAKAVEYIQTEATRKIRLSNREQMN